MKERILYMEDDAAQARLAELCLKRAGYDVDLAADGAAGLKQYLTNSYAAVVVDQTMPGLSGLEVIRAMSAQGPLPPTIMVTGTGDEKIAVKAMKQGACDYLVKDAGNSFVEMLPLVVGRAIQERRTLEEKQRIEQELAQAQKLRAIGQLASGIAHEINTPTQYIGDNTRFLQDAFTHISELLDSYEQLLKAVERDEATDELVRRIESTLRSVNLDYLKQEIPQAISQSLEGIGHVADIVGAMKEFAYPDGMRRYAVDLNHILEGAITLCRNEWKYVADVETDFDPELPAVPCTASEINRAMLNLLVNAAHATSEATRGGADGKRKIFVRTRRDADWAEIQIEDQGTGIPENIRSRVFDLFFTTKEVGQGTGQGLAIAHNIIVEKHGGTICFQTQVGRGTTFIVRLPLQGHPIREPKPSAIAPQSETIAS